MLLSRRSGVAYALLSTAVIGGVFLAESAGYVSRDPYVPLLRFIVIAAALVMTGGVIYLATRLKEQSDAAVTVLEGRFEELVRTAPEAILTVDGAGKVVTANPAAEALLQDGGPLLGRPLEALPGLSGLTGPGPVSCQVERPDGSLRDVEVELRPMLVAGLPGTRLSARDVTEQRRAERDRARLTEQLTQVQKQDSIGLLAGGIAHDFNNLISISLANLHMLQPLLQDPEAQELLTDVLEATTREAALTRQLLAFSRKQVLHAHNISPSAVIEGLRPMLSRLLKENIELRFSLEAAGIVRADQGQLEQVIVNLAVNARDAMPDGGVLLLQTRDLPDAPAQPGLAAGPCVAIAVQDTGVGMSRAVAARIFEPFFTTKEQGRGTGLGLSVVDGVMRQSGGTVSVASEEGVGTRVELLLPRAAATQADLQKVQRTVAHRGDGRGRAVLVVEDEQALRAAVARTLNGAGFRVLSAANGEEALNELGEVSAVELVITDVVMPRVGGREVVARLRELKPGLRALFMSGYTDRSLEELGAAGPDSAFLGKPFRPNELLDAVFGLLDRQAVRADP